MKRTSHKNPLKKLKTIFKSSQVLIIAFFITGILSVPLSAQSIWYVSPVGNDSNDGTSWGNAYANVQAAITTASGSDAIAIAGGIYHPGASESSYLEITGTKDGLKIYGGWAGSETFTDISDLQSQLVTRDFSVNPTIISGDIDDNDTKDSAGITLTADDISGANSNHIFFLDGYSNGKITASTIIDGLTITGGQANGGGTSSYGGGLFCYGSNSNHGCGPTLVNLIFAGNTASQGGAINTDNSSSGSGSITILNSIFTGNKATFGGAIFNSFASSGIVGLRIINSVFTGNSAISAGVMYSSGLNNNSTLTMINSTVAGNSSSGGGYILNNGDSNGHVSITNSILYNTGIKELYNVGTSPTLSHTIIRGGVDGSYISAPNIDGGGNLDANPQLIDTNNPAGDDGIFGTDDDGLQLQGVSAALEMGDNSALPTDTYDLDSDGNTAESIPYDITSADRVQGSTVDPGAYEGPVDEAEVIYVDDTATGSNDGSSWANAYSDLQNAISTATSNDIIAVATGIYYPTSGTDVNIRFTITGTRDGLKIYGGWAGTETFMDITDLQSQLNNRNFLHATILSGDIDDNDTKNAAGITMTASGIEGDNSKNIFYLDGVSNGSISNATVLDGLTITGGHASSLVGGGGIHCYGYSSGYVCNPTIRNTFFVGNLSDQSGGAIFNRGDRNGESSPVISNSVFVGNSAGTYGGAIYNYGSGNPGDGSSGSSSPNISNTTFTGNSATFGGAVYNDAGYTGTSNPTFTNVIMYGDTASVGVSSVNEIYNNSGASPSFYQSIVKGYYISSLDFDPQFMDTTNLTGDDGVFGTHDDGLRLQAGSPAIDAGDNSISGLSSTDITGRRRLLGTAVDIGAYEGPIQVKITGGEGWRMMASPFENTSYSTLLDPLWTQGFANADALSGVSNVYTWDETNQEFVSISNANDIPSPGTAFIAYIYDDVNFDAVPDGFPKIISIEETQNNGTVAPALSFTDTETLADDGWNLIGNPYGASIDWNDLARWDTTNIDATMYIWDDSQNDGLGSYLTWNGITGTLDDGIIAPWQGFWVKANAASPSLTFNDSSQSGGGVFRKQVPIPEVRFTLHSGELSSQTIVLFHEQASRNKDALDAYKLQSLNPEYLSLFTKLEDGSGLEVNALPIQLKETLPIPLALDGSNISGNLELSWTPKSLPEGMTMILTDTWIETEIDLTEASSYFFDMESKADAKIVQTQNLVSPQHKIMKPEVIKAKNSETGSRFVITMNSRTYIGNEPTADLPSKVELQQNYPNPFNPSTTIVFGMPKTGTATLEVFDLLGRKVATLLNGESRTAGRHTVKFDARNLASGMYIYRLQAGNSIIIKKLTLIK